MSHLPFKPWASGRTQNAPLRTLGLLVVCLLTLASCRTTSAPYSAAEARELNRLKSRSLRLMEQAEHPFPDKAKDAHKLMTELEAARSTAAARRGNEINAGQWSLLLDPEGHLLGGFLARWERETRLGATFIGQSMDQVRAAFESMARHESNKIGGPK